MDSGLIDDAFRMLGVSDTEIIARGGQKLVAKGRADSRDVVLKLVAIEGDHAKTALERARREVTLLETVQHDRVVRLASTLTELGNPVAAVAWLEEFIPGADVRQLMGQPWAEDDIVRMAVDVAEALGAIHAQRCVHRDLSASNVRRGTDDRYTVLDPGLARHLAEMPLTGSYQPGTPGYLSPEHVSTLSVTKPVPASDIFCLGLLLYQAATGDLPIPLGADMNAYRDRLRNGQAPPVHVARPDLGDGLAAVIDRCLSRHAARRYLNGSRLSAALEAI